MLSSCGWASLLEPQSERVVGRGRVFAAVGGDVLVRHAREADWKGEIDLLRPTDGGIADGAYKLRFERTNDQQLVYVERMRPSSAASGERPFAQLRGLDQTAPLILTVLGGDE